MGQTLGAVALLVHDYDEAIRFFTGALGFALVEDTPLGGEKRWVRVCPRGSTGAHVLLAKAATPAQAACVGRQSGGRVCFFLNTDDFWSDFQRMKQHAVRFLEAPRHESYGTVVVFEDLYGNKWDLIEPRRRSSP
jgi:catechol 2,3-dioxygenase-like lactoylglutathione lyase family enzyme